MPKDTSLRSMFNPSAHDYDAARPGYPEQVFDDILALSGMPPGGWALEVSCGTGQATLPFAQRGLHIHCLDIAAEYLRLLNTYSDHLAQDESRRAGLYGAISNLIERQYGGIVERPYLTVLYIGKKPG